MKKKFDKGKATAGASRLPVKRRAGSRSPSPTSSTPGPVRSEDQSLSVHPQKSHSSIREETASAVDELRNISDQDDANLFLPLKVALVGLVRLCHEAKESWVTESAFAAFECRVRAFEKITNVATANDIAGNNNLRKHLRVIVEVVQHLWDEIGTMAEQASNFGESKSLLEVLTNLLEVFEFDDSIAMERRLPEVHRLLSSIPVAVVMDDHLSTVIGNNSNINYAVDSSIVNNNFLNVFQRKSSVSDREKTEKILEVIKSLIGSQFVLKALYDTQPKEAGCLPGTRKGVLKKFVDWVKNDPKSIFWLAGLAGTGKTSIAITLCRMLEEDPDVLLGGTFFCSRTANEEARTDVRRILPTLATLLAYRSPQFAAGLVAELKADMGSVAHKPVSEQIGPLLQQPLAMLLPETRPTVFIIDGLDECNNERELSELLKAIAKFESLFKVKFILTSRPETHILGTPISDATRNNILQLHMIGRKEVAEDIRIYIERTFGQKSLGGLRSWYSEADVAALTSLANGLFIFASTAINYILDTDAVEDRKTRLKTALSAMKDSKVATGPLDKVYEFVITRASSAAEVEAYELRRTQRVLACILRARMPLSLNALSELLDIEPDTLRSSLRRLRAVVHVPNEPDQPDLRMLHASFGDYLFERATSEVRIIRAVGDDALARGCLQVMDKRLHFNVSQSRSSYQPNLPGKPDCIALSLEYACLQWIYHVSGSSEPPAFDEMIDQVFCPKFLFWLEVMSILAHVQRAAAILLFAAETVQLPDLSRFIRDASLFVTSSREAIEQSAPHIYISALPMAPKDSLIYETFAHRCSGPISSSTHEINDFERRLLMTLNGHDGSVNSAAYFSDGLLIGSGSSDGTVRIWDVRTGNETLSPLLSSDGEICSIAISLDGRRIVSGTAAGFVCIWNVTATPVGLRRLWGHSDKVRSVDFSPDGSLVASASDDQTVLIWTVGTGDRLVVLRGHTGGVRGIVFSPNSKLVASCSVDGTIRLWHARTGELIEQPLGEDFDPVLSICFSPDGKRLASASVSLGIQLWDIRTGVSIAKLRHVRGVTCVRFAPDGRSLVSCGDDRSIRLWALKPNSAEYSSDILGRHPLSVNSVSFSPDGLHIISACTDGTIGIWSTDDEPLRARGDVVNSVSITSDGTNLTSGSAGGSIPASDISNGEQNLQPLVGYDEGPVRSVAVSSDGCLIASGSADSTVRLWNARTGKMIGLPLLVLSDTVDGMACSLDGRWRKPESEDGAVYIWNLVPTRPPRNTRFRWKIDNSFLVVAFSSDNRSAAAACGYPGFPNPPHYGDHTTASGPAGWAAVATAAQDHFNGWALPVAYSPDGRFKALSSSNGRVILWDAVTGAQICELYGKEHDHFVSTVVFTPDSRSIVTGSTDGSISVWDVEAVLRAAASNENSNLIAALALTKWTGNWAKGPSGELLLWIPDAYRTCIKVPLCTTFNANHRVVITADGGGLNVGENWTSCWAEEM